MRRVFLTCLFVLSLAGFAGAQTFYGSLATKTFRDGRDKEFRNKTESPLKEEDFPKFEGLKYFDEDPSYIVRADFKRTSDEKYFQMPTSSGKSKKFVKYGVLTFKLSGKDYSLSVYQADAEVLKKFPEYADLLFVPFKDLTNGTETYGGGRYIDIKTPKGKKAVLNFNNSYNPNCAYGSDRYNCPIPPKENFLQTEIKAGEKKYSH